MTPDTMAALSGHIVDRWLQPPGRMMTRRTIERRALDDPDLKKLGVKPRDVTVALRVLCPDPLTRTEYPRLVGSPHAYSYGPPDPQELERCGEAIAARQRLLRPNYVGKTNELYVRSGLRHVRERGATQYRYIPNPKSLGTMRLPGTNRTADLLIGYTTADGATPTLLVEVKAHAEQLDVTSPYLARLLETARDASRYGDYQPVLIASFIDARAQSFCKAAGIAVHALGRQIIQRKDRATARELWTDADKIFQYVRIERPLPDFVNIDPRSQRDLEKFRSRAWIEEAYQQWWRLAPVRDRVVAALFEEDWGTLRVLLPDYDQAA